MSAIDIAPSDLIDQVLAESPGDSKTNWGERLLGLARSHGMDDFLQRKLIETLGNAVSQRKATLHRRRQAEDLAARAIAYTGTPLSPTISVRRADGGSQLVLWLDATPAQFVAAVFTEQNVVDGRGRANRIRMDIAMQVAEDESLAALPDLRAVCVALAVDPDSLGLDELAA